jgi:hypothetical protein
MKRPEAHEPSPLTFRDTFTVKGGRPLVYLTNYPDGVVAYPSVDTEIKSLVFVKWEDIDE